MEKLLKEQIDEIFEQAKHQVDAALALYRIAFPDWDNIKSLDGHPQVSKYTGTYIFDKFIAFDKEHHPEVVNGGLWMNKGFGSNTPVDKDWRVITSNCKIEYHEQGNKE